jgi:membrane protein DedA with SNARE-associated domain
VDPFSTASLQSAAAPYATAGLVEYALPIGLVLPGDTLLRTVGLACATADLSLPRVLAAAAAGAVLAARAGYLLGRLGKQVLLPAALSFSFLITAVLGCLLPRVRPRHLLTRPPLTTAHVSEKETAHR